MFVDNGKNKMDSNFLLQKITQLISRNLVRKTGYDAGTGVVRLLSTSNNTDFSRHIKAGCKLPVCITYRICGKYHQYNL